MAVRLYTGGTPDVFAGALGIASTNTTLSTTYQAGTAFTAPNTTNYITGVLFYVNSLPISTVDFQVEVRESGVSKVSGIAKAADLQPGYNYIRFTTPYKFTTTAANAYTPYIRSTPTNSGSVAREGAVPFLAVSYDTAAALGATDDVVVCGFHDSGLTAKTWTLTGTGNSWGSGSNKNPPTTTVRTVAATTIGQGGTLKFDTTADCKLTQYGNVFVTVGGVYDQRPGASSVSTLQFTNDADGDFTLMAASGAYGGQILTTGKTVSVAATYNGGAGTAASPATFTAAHGFAVNDELVIGWGGDYSKNEVRFVISIPAPDQLVWSSTLGGAEAALTYTHATGKPVCNLTRNSVIKNTDTSKGFSVYNSSTVAVASDFRYTRFEYPNCLSSRGMAPSSTVIAVPFDGAVLYNNSASGRTSISFTGSVTETWQDVVLYNTRGTNYSAQSGIAVAAASNKTLRRLYHFADPGSTTNCGALSIAANATSNIVDGLWSSGANAVAGGAGYAVGIYGSGNSLNNLVIDGARVQGVILDAGQGNEITNSQLGTTNTNTKDIQVSSGVLVKAAFLSCSFGSATLLSNYLATLPGSDIAFQDMDGNTSKHRWYTNRGSYWSAGAGLTNTTVRTAGSLSLAIKPEDATAGTNDLILKVPANPTSQVVFYGYLYRNATFSSGDLTVELFLPGTLLTAAPDATVTLPTTTDSWLPFTISAYYSGSVARYARVRIVAKSNVAGATAFLDDIYDAQTGNKVAGLDLWDAGHISPIIVAADYSSIPEQARVAVWSDSNTYAVGSKGRQLADVEQNTDVTQAKVDML